MDRSRYKHVHQVRVRSYEVDWQGIVHNSNYLRYFEVARIEYLKNIGARVDMKSIQGDGKIVLVRNEIDHDAPAFFDELLAISTRISFIRNSSFAMEGIMERVSDGQLISRNTAFHVWLDAATNRPKTIGDDFRKLVQEFEGESCEISWPKVDV